MNTAKLFIGIDPGKTTGMALWVPGDKLLRLHSGSFWEIYYDVLQYDKECTVIVVEDPNKNRPVFPRHGASKKEIIKIAQNVGMNKRDAQLLIEGFRLEGYTVVQVKPRGSKYSRGKMDAKQFSAMTGYKGSSNQHNRDAALLVYGLNEVEMKLFMM